MLKQIVIFALFGFIPQTLCSLYSYTQETCAGRADIKQATGDCVMLPNEYSHEVVGGTEAGWFLYPTSDCSGRTNYEIRRQDGCVDEYDYGFIAHSARAIFARN
ncbi:unnamed protein product [Cunninghamella echinulata]